MNPHLDQPLTTEVVVHGASIVSATDTVLNEPTSMLTTTSITPMLCIRNQQQLGSRRLDVCFILFRLQASLR